MPPKNDFDFDLFVIGGGSGGVRAARRWAAAGHRVAIAEERDWGGTCVHRGCIPKKLLVFAAHFAQDFADAPAYGWQLPTAPTFAWPTLIANKDRELRRLNAVYTDLLKTAGAQMVAGRARILDPHQVQVADQTYRTRRILIATGGRPLVPPIPGADSAITSDQAFHLDTLPASIIIIGGGYIAVEFACIFNGLGTKVDLLYRRDLFLRGFDLDLRQRLASTMVDQGIRLHFDADVTRIDSKNGQHIAHLRSGQKLTADQVFYATGRVPHTADLWQPDLDIATAPNGAIQINQNFQTTVPSIYALGDVVGKRALTPVAIAEAEALLQHWRTGTAANFDYCNIPAAVFSAPNLATVGLTEQEATDRGLDCAIYQTDFRHLKHTLTGRKERVYMKLLVDRPTDRILGAHMLGPEAGEIIQSIAIAIQASATKSDFDRTIGIHPTMAEEWVTMHTPRP